MVHHTISLHLRHMLVPARPAYNGVNGFMVTGIALSQTVIDVVYKKKINISFIVLQHRLSLQFFLLKKPVTDSCISLANYSMQAADLHFFFE